MHPDDVLAELLKSAGTRRRKSLETIHAVCREQFERGAKDFSIATIARLSVARGGPADGSIRNKAGDDFKAVISVWAKHTGGSTRKLPKVSEDPLMALIQKVEAPEVRSILAGVLAENRKLRREVNLLKHAASQTNYIDLRKDAEAPTSTATELIPAPTGLADSELAALRHAVSSEKLAEEGWSIDERGYIVNENGRPIFKVGFVPAIKKLVAAEERQSRKRT